MKAKLESGEIKRYSEFRNAIAPYLGEEFTFNYDIRTSEGKQKLLELASQLMSNYNEATEVTAETAFTVNEQVEAVECRQGDYVIQLSSEDTHEAFTVDFPSFGFDRILYADSEEEAHEIAIEFLIHNKSPIPIASPSTNKQSSNRLESIEWQLLQIISDADSSQLRNRLNTASSDRATALDEVSCDA
ncbi:MAG: hypothetical protein WBF90_13850 [Rivularia sp. (in: cyanobacteria)]